MVAIGEHDHSDGEMCPGCRFREALAEFLESAHGEGREEWHWAIGELRQHMHTALLALDAIEAQPFAEDDDPDDDPAEDAAAAITAVGAEIDHLWQSLVGDDDDQGDG